MGESQILNALKGSRSQQPNTVPVVGNRWDIPVLLAGFSLAAYMARTNVSIAAKFIMPEFGLTQIQMGQVFGAFMLSYAIFQIPAGLLGDRFGPRNVLAASGIAWGILTV